MDNHIELQQKYKKISIMFVILFLSILAFPYLGVKFVNFYANPADKYRGEFTSPTAHMIIIDDHFHVATTSSNQSYLVYSETPEGRFRDEVYSQSVDKLNWTDEFILVGAQSETSGKYSYMILDRATREVEGYTDEEAFDKGREEKGIEADVLDKKYFDWY